MIFDHPVVQLIEAANLKKSPAVPQDCSIKISVVVPTYNTDPIHLKEAVFSVTRSIYPNWELVICDDGSTSAETLRVLRGIEDLQDPRIVVVRNEENQGIAAATNHAIKVSTGSVIAFMDHDDVLLCNALGNLVGAYHRHPEMGVIYTNQMSMNSAGDDRNSVYLAHAPSVSSKPGYRHHLFLQTMYINHLKSARRTLIESAGYMRDGFNGSQDYDLFLRLMEQLGDNGEEKVGHIPLTGYIWRHHSKEFSSDTDRLGEMNFRALEAIQEHLERIGSGCKAFMGRTMGIYTIQRPIPAGMHNEKVSIIIPTLFNPGRLREQIASIIRSTHWPKFEIVISCPTKIGSESVLDSAIRSTTAMGIPVKVVRSPHHREDFHFSKVCNLAAQEATGGILCFLNDDVEVTPGWLTAMVREAHTDTGCVGVEMRSRKTKEVIHTGIGFHENRPVHVYCNPARPPNTLINCLSKETVAVTGACMLVRRDFFDECGGFCEDYQVYYQDVDLGLMAVSKGLKNVMTTATYVVHEDNATLMQMESAPLHHVMAKDLKKLHSRFNVAAVEEADVFSRHWRDTQELSSMILPWDDCVVDLNSQAVG